MIKLQMLFINIYVLFLSLVYRRKARHLINFLRNLPKSDKQQLTALRKFCKQHGDGATSRYNLKLGKYYDFTLNYRHGQLMLRDKIYSHVWYPCHYEDHKFDHHDLGINFSEIKYHVISKRFSHLKNKPNIYYGDYY